MKWKAYQQPHPMAPKEMQTIIEYNEVGCKAMWMIFDVRKPFIGFGSISHGLFRYLDRVSLSLGTAHDGVWFLVRVVGHW
jgi:hypothetical protein